MPLAETSGLPPGTRHQTPDRMPDLGSTSVPRPPWRVVRHMHAAKHVTSLPSAHAAATAIVTTASHLCPVLSDIIGALVTVVSTLVSSASQQ